MGNEQHSGDEQGHPRLRVFQELGIRQHDEAQDQHRHILAVEHRRQRNAQRERKRPGGLVEVATVQEEEEGGEKEQRCIGGGDETIDREHHEGGGDGEEGQHITAGGRLRGYRPPNQAESAAVEQHRKEADREVPLEKRAAESGEQRHHRRVVVVTPVEVTAVERIVSFVGMQRGEYGHHQIGYNPQNQKDAKQSLRFHNGCKRTKNKNVETPEHLYILEVSSRFELESTVLQTGT